MRVITRGFTPDTTGLWLARTPPKSYQITAGKPAYKLINIQGFKFYARILVYTKLIAYSVELFQVSPYKVVL